MRFRAIEHALPATAVTNDQVLERIESQSAAFLTAPEMSVLLDWVQQCFASARTTIRYHRSADESASELACRAGQRAIAASGLHPEDVDLLIYVGIGRGMLEPASATIFQDLLKLRRATCFDVLDACASWIRGLDVADAFLRSGKYQNIMIVNAELLGGEAYRYQIRSLSEFAHWHPSVTIGDAATATIVSGSEEARDFETSFRTWGDKRGLCFVPLPHFRTYFGSAIPEKPEPTPYQFFSYGLRLIEFGSRKLLEHIQATPHFLQFKPDIIFGHSASDNAMEQVVKQCGYPVDHYVSTHHRFANTVSASLPLAMSVALKEHRLAENDQVLLLMASAGLTTGLAKFTFVS